MLKNSGYTHNPYNGVVCNEIIMATGVFSSKELWRLSKSSILQEMNEPQPPINSVKVEHPAYYCNSYTDQGNVVGDRSSSVETMVVSGAYSMPQNTTLVSSSSQAASPSNLFYQHSPDTHHHHQNHIKYPENGHDTLSDFVTFVCQETENSQQNAQMQSSMSRSPKSQYFPSTMLPPPPLPPMARPVAIIRSTGDVTMSGTNSPPTSITPPGSEASPGNDVPELNTSPPLSPGSQDCRKSPSQRSSVQTNSPYSPNRDYPFNHFHPQPGHVGSTSGVIRSAGINFDVLQLFSYPSMSGMSGVISPTNLSMYSPSVNTSRGTQRTNAIPRWSTPLFSLDQEDFSMIHPVSGTNSETNSVILMEEAATASASEHSTQCCTGTNLMCDPDRFFQSGVTGDGMETSVSREGDTLPVSKSP